MQYGILERGGLLDSIEVRDTFMEESKAKKFEDENLEDLRRKTTIGKAQETILYENGVLKFRGRICVPWLDDFIEKLSAVSWFAICYPPGVTKIYRDMKQFYCWPGMNKDIVEFLLECQIAHK